MSPLALVASYILLGLVAVGTVFLVVLLVVDAITATDRPRVEEWDDQ